MNKNTWRVLDALGEIAEAHGCPPAQIAIAWLLTRPTVSGVLLGARTTAQLDQTLSAAALALHDEEVARLTAVSAPGLPPYPYGMVADFCAVPHWTDLGTTAPADPPRPRGTGIAERTVPAAPSPSPVTPH